MSSTLVVVKKAMVSSTARDLPEHRKQVMDACQRQTFFPLMMEHLPASDAEAISASLAMVDQSEVYIGVYAYRYGYVPAGHSISVIEMEYNRAVERKIPRLIFIVDKKHPVTIDDVEMGEAAEKLKVFKDRVGQENIVNFFSSPEELRSFVLNSLSKLPKEEGVEFRYHYVSDIPEPPLPYIAHPYVLSQAKGLVGRQAELNLLTDWFTGKKGLGSVRIFNVVAIGGMGKSALTWKWFNEIAPQEQPYPFMAGRMWWSFYESDAYFENFIIRALAYVGRMSIEEAQKIPPGQREDKLLVILDREPHLIVLDGLERILIAYARMDASLLADDDAYDKATANYLARAHGLSESEKKTFLDKHRLRKTVDPRAGNFLRKLTRVRASWILVNTRLYPFDFQTITGSALPGCEGLFLKGLNDGDVLNLWQNFGVTGTPETLLPMFLSFGSHPLLLQALAGEVARFRPAPGDFNAWQKAKPIFNPFQLELKQAKTHVLKFALDGLSQEEWKALHTIAAFRMPAQYDTLRSLLCGEYEPCTDEEALDKMLGELEDRGLLGWDRRANRYDLHPVVRGVVWSLTNSGEKHSTFLKLQVHFEAYPQKGHKDINSLEDLTPTIELYHALIGLKRFELAFDLFQKMLFKPLSHRLGMSRIIVDLLEKFNSTESEHSSKLIFRQQKIDLFAHLASTLNHLGKPTSSIYFFEKILENNRTNDKLYRNLSDVFHLTGKLKKSIQYAYKAYSLCEEGDFELGKAISLYRLGLITSTIGVKKDSLVFLNTSLEFYKNNPKVKNMASVYAYLAQRSMNFGEIENAFGFSNQAWESGQSEKYNRGIIRASRLQGESALALKNLTMAAERLHHALTRTRDINYVEEELPALIALAKLARQQNKPAEARDHLDDVWEYAERGPYPLFHADARNVLCQIERDAGNTAAAIEAATYAYRLAWCDGPPYAYHYGLENAKKHLKELGASEPEMPKTEHT